MSSFKEYQTQNDSASFLHPLAPGSHGVGGYCRVPGPFGDRNFSNNSEKFGEIRNVSNPFSPAMKNAGSDVIEKIEKTLAYGPEDVPVTMKKKGWIVAARLIEHWLSGPAKIMPEPVREGEVSAKSYGVYNSSIVSMEWVQSFPRAKIAVSELKTKLRSDKAKKAIIGKIFRNFPGVSISDKTLLHIDNTQLDVVDLHTKWQFQFQSAGSITDTLDGLTAGLGRFSVMAAIRKAEVVGFEVRVSKIGIYVRDTFDFSGWQPLGCWTDNDVTRFGVNQYCTRMSNDVFEEYRIKNDRGMDFLIFSDVLNEDYEITAKINAK